MIHNLIILLQISQRNHEENENDRKMGDLIEDVEVNQQTESFTDQSLLVEVNVSKINLLN